jgi:ubiquinone/menaquinone biosynthesis C-methylase UbiE
MANRFFIKEVLLNKLIKIPFIQNWSNKNGSTGRNENPDEVRKVYDKYKKASGDITNKSVLELGPGHTFGNLLLALKDGASKVYAADIMEYVDSIDSNIEYKEYDGKQLPYQDGTFDFVWSWTVYEHLRHPEITLPETFRVLKKGGLSVSFIDLVDHFVYGPFPEKEEDIFDCLSYSENEWKLMTSNRSTYVNRLRLSDWKKLFEKSGFEIIECDEKKSNIIKELLKDGKLSYLNKYSVEDAITRNIFVVAQKK